MTPEEKISEIRKYGKRAQGQRELIACLKGQRVTPLGLIRAYCYDCMSYFADGIVDCDNPICPLYKRQPYGKHAPPGKKSLPIDDEGGGVPDNPVLPRKETGVMK